MRAIIPVLPRPLRLIFCAILLLACPGAASAVDASPESASPHAEIMRRWLAGAPPETSTADIPAEDALWIEYLELEAQPPAPREAGLRDILDRDPPDSLRRIVLLDLQSDLRFQSAQAQFIRRYGFYANWFNRTVYVASRAIQGNAAAAGQLVVDAVFDTTGPGRATAAERRLYKLLESLRAEGRTTRQDRERLRELRDKIADAQASVDLERAEWSLRQGQPELALFYAVGTDNPRAKSKAGRIVQAAEAEIARRTRGNIASTQAGFPDREPPMDINSAPLLRAAAAGSIIHHSRNSLLIPGVGGNATILVTSSTQPYWGEVPEGATVEQIRTENFVLAWMLTTMKPDDGDPVAMMRRWARVIESMGVGQSRTRWVTAGLEDPGFNPELRLLRAQSARRASLARFIFLGPQTGRERAYVASSRVAQTWNAIASVGVFYVFEIFYRAGISAFSPPPPADEVLDAQADFLRTAPGFSGAKEIAGQLADQYLEAGRPDDAERTLTEHGGVSKSEQKRISRARALAALNRAESLPHGGDARKVQLDRVRELVPGTRLAARADKLEKAKPPRGERIEVRAAWDAVAGWMNAPAPSGLPGDPLWFDDDASNGEADAETFFLECEDGRDPPTVTITYFVRFPDRREIVSEEVPLSAFTPGLLQWVTLALEEGRRQNREAGRLGRTPIPYEFTGGAGVSGVDFYPRLLPIEPREGENRLYEDLKDE